MLWAVHISSGVLTWPWIVGGLVIAALLLVAGCWRLQPEEVPRIALLTAVFYIGSSIHIPVGVTSIHLLLNGLVGVVVGWRSALAILVGLLFQAVFIGHGGYLEIGVNTCVIAPPALLAGAAFRGLNRVRWLKHPTARAVLVALSVALWIVGAVASVSLLWLWLRSGENAYDGIGPEILGILAHPVTVCGALLCGAVAAWVERRMEQAPEFPLGMLLGVVTVMTTVALNCLVLMGGGAFFGPTPPLVLAIVYLPVAAIEGVVTGFTVGFLAKVKPELIGIAAPSRAAYGGNTSSSATSH
jgi:cobalt/nickel transport system permease protein